MMRTSTFSGLVPPTGTKVPSCNTRRSFTCIAGLMSATSSRKNVPPSATLNRPGLSRVAPVNDPFTCPNSSDSSSWSLSAEQFWATNCLSLRGPLKCSARAISSFPVAFAREGDGRADDLEAHVAGPEQRGAARELLHSLFDALVAAAQAFAIAEAGGTDPVLGRDDDALALLQHETPRVGEGELDAPPAPDRFADPPDDLELFQACGVDGHGAHPSCCCSAALQRSATSVTDRVPSMDTTEARVPTRREYSRSMSPSCWAVSYRSSFAPRLRTRSRATFAGT